MTESNFKRNGLQSLLLMLLIGAQNAQSFQNSNIPSFAYQAQTRRLNITSLNNTTVNQTVARAFADSTYSRLPRRDRGTESPTSVSVLGLNSSEAKVVTIDFNLVPKLNSSELSQLRIEYWDPYKAWEEKQAIEPLLFWYVIPPG